VIWSIHFGQKAINTEIYAFTAGIEIFEIL